VLRVVGRPIVDTIDLELCRFWLFLMALRRRPRWFFLGRRFYDPPSGPRPQAIDSRLGLQGPGFALGAGMCKVRIKGVIHIIGVIAPDVLPCIARLAVDRISVIVSEVADTLDGVRLLLDRLLLPRGISTRDGIRKGEGGLTRKRDRRRQRRQLVGHNPEKSLGTAAGWRRYRAVDLSLRLEGHSCRAS
jgi:hypothetical protein